MEWTCPIVAHIPTGCTKSFQSLNMIQDQPHDAYFRCDIVHHRFLNVRCAARPSNQYFDDIYALVDIVLFDPSVEAIY